MHPEELNDLADVITPLELATLTWRIGYDIDLDLAASLMAEGYDVQALEDRYKP